MYIPRRQLRRLVYLCLALMVVLTCLARGYLLRTRPAWIATYWQPEFDYLPDYTKGPPIGATSAILLEATTGTILYGKNEHVRRAPASTTKILTALLALENGNLQDIVTISPRAASTRGSTARITARQRIPLGDLLYGLLLPSGNDAAVAIGEHIAGSEAAFVAQMNARALELGALDTHFVNPHGLDNPQHYTTAFDLAMITRIALLYPEFAHIVAQSQHSAGFDGSRWQWSNTNRLLFSFEGAVGVKTGTTSGAGNCLVAAATRDGRQLICVVLASPNRWHESTRLLEYGFTEFHLLPLALKGQILATVAIKGGLQPAIQATAGETLYKVVRNGDVDDIHAHVVITKTSAPLRRGQQIGRIEYTLHAESMGQIPLLAAQNVGRWTPLSKLWRDLKQLFRPSPKEHNWQETA